MTRSPRVGTRARGGARQRPMGDKLNQDAVFVLAFDSDSFLIELEEGG